MKLLCLTSVDPLGQSKLPYLQDQVCFIYILIGPSIDRLQSLLILSKFKRINERPFPLKLSENRR